jgi:8-oxo-dGTP diphosphatase
MGADWGDSGADVGASSAKGSFAAVDVLVGIIGDAEGRVLVNRRRPGTHMAGYWEFPGGKRAAGEGRFEALRRELQEELGIDVLEAVPLVELVHEYPEKRVALDVWIVKRYSGAPRSCEGQDLRWVEASALAGIGLLPADGPIIDALLEHLGRAD